MALPAEALALLGRIVAGDRVLLSLAPPSGAPPADVTVLARATVARLAPPPAPGAGVPAAALALLTLRCRRVIAVPARCGDGAAAAWRLDRDDGAGLVTRMRATLWALLQQPPPCRLRELVAELAPPGLQMAGLMVGRTPEYLGKKIEAREVKMAMLAILILPLSMLGFTALAVMTNQGLAGPLNTGPHGFSEILYAFTSATANNGSAFAGLTANTHFYNTTLGLAMLIGRFLMIVPMMAVAGALVGKKIAPASAGTFPTHGGLFIGLLVGVILIVGGLTFFPVLSLGPIVEHLAMQAGTFF